LEAAFAELAAVRAGERNGESTVRVPAHQLPDLLARRLERYEWCVTFVTLGELAKWGELHNWGMRRWTKLANWVGQTLVLLVDNTVTYTWGLLAAHRTAPRSAPASQCTWIAAARAGQAVLVDLERLYGGD
jgi:hypothetical protein